MKKKNWLMTIAFAVLALTIVSTCVIGSTYARFTSQVGSNGGVRAAGFYVSGSGAASTVTLTAETQLIAPGETKSVDLTFEYFSEVDTEFTLTDSNQTGAVYGIGNFANVDLSEYNTTLAGVFTVAYYRVNGQTETAVTGSSLPEVVAAAVRLATNDQVGTGATVKAMTGATSAVTVTLRVKITWTQTTGTTDARDTYLGNLVYNGLHQDTPVYSGVGVTLGLTASQVISQNNG